MLSSARGVRLIAGAVGVGAVAAAVFVATAPPGSAEPPPNCTAADLAGVMSGVAASTSAYLFTHPDVAADLQGIRQPSVDFRNRCGGSP